ncbi:hypothetical protein F4557_000768 [Actinomadura catellatispora]|uniref:Uncharacterized protein n=1 Tax=Actinomadura livida TaxID=79909 RepID=A0A7W7I8E5_9ACTN|nr:hypothetical protein [Actinomadura catellatispora]
MDEGSELLSREGKMHVTQLLAVTDTNASGEPRDLYALA